MTSENNSKNSWTPWILALLVAIFLVFCFLHHLKGIESDISSRSTQALSAGTISGITADVDGRDVTLNGELTKESNRIEVVETVSKLRGVNKVVDNLTLKALPPSSFKLLKDDKAISLSAIVESEEEKTKLIDTFVSDYQLQKDQISSSIEVGAANPSIDNIIDVVESAAALSKLEINSSNNAFSISGIAPSDSVRDTILQKTNLLTSSNLSVTESIQVPAKLQLQHLDGEAVLSGNLPEDQETKSQINTIPNLRSEITYANHYIDGGWIKSGIDLIQNDAIESQIDTTISPSSVELTGELASKREIEGIESKVVSMFGPSHAVTNNLTEALPAGNLQIALNDNVMVLDGVLLNNEQIDATVNFANSRYPNSKIVNNLIVGAAEDNGDWLKLSLDSINQLPETADFSLNASDSNITVQAIVETPEEQTDTKAQISEILSARDNTINIEFDEDAFNQKQAKLEKQRLAEIEKQKQAELEKQRLAELEKQKQAELEKQRLAELEKQKQAELEKQRLAEIEKERLAELEKQRLAEIEKERLAELERQAREAAIAQAISNLDLSGIQFATNSADILGESEPVLNQAYEVLKQYSSIIVRVEGHTDSTGDNDLNLALSNARAESVKSYLTSKGISSQRIQAKGFGEENPIAPNNTADGRKQNRRIEFKVIN